MSSSVEMPTGGGRHLAKALLACDEEAPAGVTEPLAEHSDLESSTRDTGAGSVGTSASRSESGPHRRRRNTSLADALSLGAGALEKHSHRIPVSQYLFLGLWLILLCANYGVVRLGCWFGVPRDHHDDADIVKVLEDFQYMLFGGFVLAIMTGLHWPDRFLYVFCLSPRRPRGVMFLLAFFGSGIGWGFLDMIPGLSGFTLTSFNAEYLLPVVLLVVGTVSLLSLHLWWAYKYNSTAGFWAYLISRAALIAFYSAYLVVKLQPGHADEVVFHFHHYAVGLIAASLAEFNHPLSVLLLACGAGVFVQGLAAYDADPILENVAERSVSFSCVSSDGTRVYSPLVSKAALEFIRKYLYCRG
mmetsp:Transcript_32779/g.59925  ORF Transcript_32779/g.59925 Transcript_32779/m.59925 type:complete len:358 (-) Transcript_32779:203-1276(-)